MTSDDTPPKSPPDAPPPHIMYQAFYFVLQCCALYVWNKRNRGLESKDKFWPLMAAFLCTPFYLVYAFLIEPPWDGGNNEV